MSDIKYAKLAIELAKKSFDQDLFPAGALIVRDNEIVSEQIATPFPKFNLHPESKCIDDAMNVLNAQLTDCTLYTSIQPCLMCLSRAYWAGIRRIVYVIKKENVNHKLCYESNLRHEEIVEKFNEKVEMVQLFELEQEALDIYNKWVKKNNL